MFMSVVAVRLGMSTSISNGVHLLFLSTPIVFLQVKKREYLGKL